MTGGNSRIEVDLNSLDWLLTNAVGSHKLQTHLPASVLQVLHRHGVVEDPLYRYQQPHIYEHARVLRAIIMGLIRFNEQECRWVAEDSWSMRCDFDVTLPLLSHYAVDLLLSGVDTVADVLINGKHITQLDNAFRCDSNQLACTPSPRPHQGVSHPRQKHAAPGEKHTGARLSQRH